MSGDTGVGIVIHTPDSLPSGAYRLAGPDDAAISPPAATLAARWLDSTEVFAFRSTEGRLELEAGERLHGTFTARGRRWGAAAGEMDFAGGIHGVPIGPCEPAATGR
jgi:hypothetical protein